MHDIKCPHCEKVFKVDEAGFADILKQVRDGQFEKEIHERLEIAEKENADAVAHGSTGKGNDQVRFDINVSALNPKLKIIAPVREWKMSREAEIEYAKKQGIKTIGFTGGDGGELKDIADIVFNVPADYTPIIQECHIMAIHIICKLVEESLF